MGENHTIGWEISQLFGKIIGELHQSNNEMGKKISEHFGGHLIEVRDLLLIIFYSYICLGAILSKENELSIKVSELDQ